MDLVVVPVACHGGGSRILGFLWGRHEDGSASLCSSWELVVLCLRVCALDGGCVGGRCLGRGPFPYLVVVVAFLSFR